MIGPRARVGYLVKTFPKISETFILREVLALEAAGVELEIFALRRPAEKKTHALAAQVRARIQYLPSGLSPQPFALVWPQLWLLLMYPMGYFRAVRFALRHQAKINDILQAACLAWSLRRAKIEHLHVHFINEPASVAELVQLMTGMVLSVTAHAKDIYLSPRTELARKMKRAKFVVTCNDYNRRLLQQVAPDGPPVLRIYHGLDTELFTTEGAERAREPVPMILSVGRLREKKGFPILLAACRLLKVAGRQFRCVIAGYGPLRDELERQIEAFDLQGSVALTGMLTQEEVIALYQRATLFVLPCQITEDGDRDGIPNVLIEAMAMELPVVTTRVAGIPELVDHEHNGLLVQSEDPVSLTAAITRLLDRPQLRSDLGTWARQTVLQHFCAARNARRLQDLFGGSTAAQMTEESAADVSTAPAQLG